MKKNLTELVFILDRSGSMCGLPPNVSINADTSSTKMRTGLRRWFFSFLSGIPGSRFLSFII